MAMLELADLYGALEAVAESLGTNMSEVKIMSKATASAFSDGSRATHPPSHPNPGAVVHMYGKDSK